MQKTTRAHKSGTVISVCQRDFAEISYLPHHKHRDLFIIVVYSKFYFHLRPQDAIPKDGGFLSQVGLCWWV